MHNARDIKFRLPWKALGPLRLVVGLLFVLAAFGKLVSYENTIRQVATRQWIPDGWVQPIADLLILLEFGLGLLFVTGRALRPTAVCGALLSAAFSLLTFRRLLAGETGACFCLGNLLPLPTPVMFLLDVALVVSCLCLFRDQRVETNDTEDKGRALQARRL